MVVTAGDIAPDFSLLDSDNNEFNFSDLDGSWKVLFFYAKMVRLPVREDV